MTGRRKWAAIPGLVLVAAFATALSAWSGARSHDAEARLASEQTPPAAPQPTDSGALRSAPAATGAPAATTQSGGPAEGSTRTVVVDVPDTNPAHGPWGYSAASSDQNFSPVQPVRFPHPSHVQKAGMNCVYCHFAANKSSDVGMPAVGTCMGCHTLVKGKAGTPTAAEIKKLDAYWNVADPTKSKPIPWVRIHKVPDYVNFPHMRHVSAGVTCQTCHGEVQKMNQVFQYASLNMGWCINCHIQKQARYDCAVCHY
jgi:hypothetical protein